jgi:hypothetical protein
MNINFFTCNNFQVLTKNLKTKLKMMFVNDY